MPKLLRPTTALVALALLAGPLAAGPAPAQTTTPKPAFTTTDDLSDVRPFQGWFTDATITEGVDVEPELQFGNGDFFTRLFAGARVAAWVRPNLEVGGQLGIVNYDFESAGSETGLSDLRTYARYRLLDSEVDFSVGGVLDLPTGSEDAGQSRLDLLLFVATRVPVGGGNEFTGSAGIENLDGPDRETGVVLNGGLIVPVAEEVAVVGELNIRTAYDTAATLSAGIDYEMPPGGHLRGGIAVGLNNNSEDVALFASFAIPVW